MNNETISCYVICKNYDVLLPINKDNGYSDFKQMPPLC